MARTTWDLEEDRAAYKQAFGSPAGQIVLEDLSEFCRANEVCYNDNERKSWMLEGRREVWLRIQNHIGLTMEELAVLHGAQLSPPKQE